MNSKIYSGSQRAYKNDLSIFTLPQTSVGIVESSYTTIFPQSSFADNVNPINFQVHSVSDYYEPNSALLYIQAKVVKPNGTDIAATDKIAVVHNLACALFDNVEIMINNVPTIRQSLLYPYKYFLQDIVYMNSPLEKNNLKLQLFYPDDSPNDFGATNFGHKTRASICAESKVFEVLVRIADPFCFRQNRLLLPDNYMSITFRRSPAPFCLDGVDSRTNTAEAFPFKIKLMECYLNIKRYVLHQDLVKQHQSMLSKGQRANYPLKVNDIQVVSIPKDTITYNSDVIYSGKLPKFILICFINQEALNGVITKSPFSFSQNNIESASIIVEGEISIYKKIDLAENKKFLAFLSVQNLLAKHNSKFTLDSMEKGNFFLTFELSAEINPKNLHIQPTGQLRLILKFSIKTTETINCLLFSETESLLQIGRNQQTWSEGLVA